MSELGVEELRKIAGKWADTMKANRDHLIELDGVAGDSDLGLTMTDGFASAKETADKFDGTDIGKMIYQCGKAIMSSAPSSLGTLLGSGFLEAGKRLKGRESLPLKESYIIFEAIEDKVKDLGNSKVGDKTFIDGLDPAVESLKCEDSWNDGEESALEAAIQASKQGVEAAKMMVARHGRMAIRGEESIGMIDPGSVVASYLIQGFAESLIENL